MTWDGVVTNYHKKYIQELGIQPSLEAYIQSVVLKKTLESISLERRRGHDQDEAGEEEVERAVEKLVDSRVERGDEQRSHELIHQENLMTAIYFDTCQKGNINLEKCLTLKQKQIK